MPDKPKNTYSPVMNARARVPMIGPGPYQFRKCEGPPPPMWDDDPRHADIAAATELIVSGAVTAALVKMHLPAPEIALRANVKSVTVSKYRKEKSIPAHEVGARVAAVIIDLCAEADAMGDQ